MKRRFLALAGLALGVVGLHGVVWLAGGWLLRREVASLLATASERGWTVSTGQRATGGWPLAATLTMDRPAIAGGERTVPGGLAWSADRLVARVSLLHPLTLVLSAQGQQFLRLSHAPDLSFTAMRTEARLGLWAGSQGWGVFEADDVAAGIAGSRNPQDVLLGTVRVRVHQSEAPAGPGGHAVMSVSIDARAHDVGLPDVGRWPLGDTIADAGAEVTLVALPPPAAGVPPPPSAAGVTGGAHPVAELQAAAWRDRGGHVQVGRALLHWGPLLLEGSAEMSLDAGLQPAGSGTVRVAGTGPALDAAAGGGLIAPGVALTVKAVLGFMPQDRDGAVRLPFRVRDRTVSVGRIPLAQIGQVVW